MTRIEIFANQALEKELLQILPLQEGSPCYSLIRQVEGAGLSGLCLGNQVWPEENILVILYLDETQLEPLAQRLRKLREDFPLQGLAIFALDQAREIM